MNPAVLTDGYAIGTEPKSNPRLAYTTVHVAPRMEWSKRVDSVSLSMDSDPWGWARSARLLLAPTSVPENHGRFTLDSKTGERKPLKMKGCAPGLLPYLLPTNMARGKPAARKAEWTLLPFDLDAVGLPVAEVMAIIDRAFSGIRRLVWTTWSCQDGYASVRVMLVANRTMTFQGACLAWWWGRRRLVEAGLPEDSVKPMEPSVDSRGMDGRLYYLPSHPASRVADTTNKWGGFTPTWGWGADDDLPFDVARVLAEASPIRSLDEPKHKDRWPSVPVPEGSNSSKVKGPGARWDGTRGGGKWRFVDFTQVQVDRVDLLTWARVTIPEGGTLVCGNPWQEAPREAGTTWRDGTSARLHHEEGGRVWLHSFKEGQSYGHADGGLPDGVDPIEALLERVISKEDQERFLEAEKEEAAQVENYRAEFSEFLAFCRRAIEARLSAAQGVYQEHHAEMEATRKAVTNARKLVTPRLRAHYSKLGVPRGKCGSNPAFLGLSVPGVCLGWRGCSSQDCPTCGPVRVGLKVGGVVWGPVVVDGQVEPSMGSRTLYVYEFPRSATEGWWDRIRNLGRITAGKTAMSEREGDIAVLPAVISTHHPWVTFEGADPMVTAITDVDLPMPKRGSKPKSGAPVKVLRHQDEVLEYLLALVERYYTLSSPSMESIDMVDGDTGPDEQGKSKPRVLGKIRSSDSVRLDPEALLKLASAGAAVQVSRHGDLGEASRTAKGLGLQVSRGDQEGNPTLSVQGFTKAQQLEAMVAAVGGELPYGSSKKAFTQGLHDALLGVLDNLLGS